MPWVIANCNREVGDQLVRYAPPVERPPRLTLHLVLETINKASVRTNPRRPREDDTTLDGTDASSTATARVITRRAADY
jgi:hypothetical protein